MLERISRFAITLVMYTYAVILCVIVSGLLLICLIGMPAGLAWEAYKISPVFGIAVAAIELVIVACLAVKAWKDSR